MAETDKSLYVRMDSYEKQLDKVKEEVEVLKSNKSYMERMVAVTELHINEIRKREEKQELREERQETTMAQLTSTLTNMNENLNKLNDGQDELNQSQNELESRMDKFEEKGRLDILALIKNILVIGIPTAVLTYFGLK